MSLQLCRFENFYINLDIFSIRKETLSWSWTESRPWAWGRRTGTSWGRPGATRPGGWSSAAQAPMTPGPTRRAPAPPPRPPRRRWRDCSRISRSYNPGWKWQVFRRPQRANCYNGQNIGRTDKIMCRGRFATVHWSVYWAVPLLKVSKFEPQKNLFLDLRKSWRRVETSPQFLALYQR